MGHVYKIVMRFREPFWENRQIVGSYGDFSFALCLDAAFPTWWTQQPLQESVLTGWAGGPHAEVLQGCTRETILEKAIESLSQTFHLTENELRAQFLDWNLHDWNADVFARGAYSYPRLGGIDAARCLAEPVDSTLFFAGEATDWRGYSGTVHGALESGVRACREILGS
jgi:monoamine oxidase